MKLSSSSLSRAKSCLWWARPDVQYTPAPDTGAGEEGQEVHGRIASAVLRKPYRPNAPQSPRIAALVDSALTFLRGQHPAAFSGLAEEAYAYDVVTQQCRILGVDINREYGELGDAEIPGTADLIYIENGVLCVDDWKTGSPEFVETVSENSQLQFLGLCAVRARGWTGLVRLGVVYVRERGCYPERHLTSADELMRFGSHLQLLYIQTPDASANAGEHCRFCPARGGCPATTATMKEFATQHALSSNPPGLTVIDRRLPVWTTQCLSADNDALMAEQLPALKKAVEAVEEALKDRCRAQGGIRLPDGKIWKEVSYTKSVMDNAKVEELLGDRFHECRKEIVQVQMRRVKG